MQKVALIAARQLTYDGRALKPGDPFAANQQDVRILVGAKIATYDTRAATPAPADNTAAAADPTTSPPTGSAADDPIVALRQRYETLSGKKPAPTWRVRRLEAEIAALAPATPESPASEPTNPDATKPEDKPA